MSSVPSKRAAFFKAIVIAATVACAAAVLVAFRARLFWLPSGSELQVRAWEAGFRERGLPAPPGGMREGVDDQRIQSNRIDPPAERLDDYRRDPEIGWREAEVHVPGLLDTDRYGRQSVETPGARLRVLILGGSVAFGGASSSLETTYFAQLARLLAERSCPANLVVGATGSWRSVHEVKALYHRDMALKPDVVVFLNGLNDLTNAFSLSEDERVSTYLTNMHAGRALALKNGIRVVFALQPCISDKKRKSLLEKRIIELSAPVDVRMLRRGFARMRRGLTELAAVEGAHFIDCSGVFDDEPATTFCDMWHFSDPGHRILAERLAQGLEPVLRSLLKDADAKR